MITAFGKFTRKLRVDNNELMKDMAAKLEVTTSYLSAVENGKRKIPVNWGNQIASQYELTEQQATELMKLFVIDTLSVREKEALRAATSVLYLNDSTDYINGLWDVVRALVGDNVVENEGFNLREIAVMLGAFGD